MSARASRASTRDAVVHAEAQAEGGRGAEQGVEQGFAALREGRADDVEKALLVAYRDSSGNDGIKGENGGADFGRRNKDRARNRADDFRTRVVLNENRHRAISFGIGAGDGAVGELVCTSRTMRRKRALCSRDVPEWAW